jgi:hypothetical protein
MAMKSIFSALLKVVLGVIAFFGALFGLIMLSSYTSDTNSFATAIGVGVVVLGAITAIYIISTKTNCDDSSVAGSSDDAFDHMARDWDITDPLKNYNPSNPYSGFDED